MKVNRPLNTLYRYCRANPEAAQRLSKNIEPLESKWQAQIANDTGKAFEATASNKNATRIIDSFANFAETVWAIRPFTKEGKKIKIASETIIEPFEKFQKTKVMSRQALRIDPKLNVFAKKLLKDVKNPAHNKDMKVYTDALRENGIDKTHTAFDAMLDTALALPQKLGNAYANLEGKAALERMEPLNQNYARIIESIVKK